MSKVKIPIDESHMKIQQCTPERQNLVDQLQEVLGDDIPLPKCADVKLLEDGSIVARSMTENGTVHSVDIYADGSMTRTIFCSDGDRFVDTPKGEKKTCENLAIVPEIPNAISESKLKKAQALLLKADATVEGFEVESTVATEDLEGKQTLADEIQKILEDKVALHSTSEVRPTPDGGIEAIFTHPTGTMEYIFISKNGTARRTVVKKDSDEKGKTKVVKDAVKPEKVKIARLFLMSKAAE
jgi:hypothetical protein